MAQNNQNAVEQPAAAAAPSLLSTISKMVLFMYVYKWFTGGSSAAPRKSHDAQGRKVIHQNLWKMNDRFDIRMYLSQGLPEVESFDDDYLDFAEEVAKWEPFSFDGERLFEKTEILYNWEEEDHKSEEFNLECTPHLQNNGSLWAHAYFFHAGMSPDPSSPEFDKRTVESHFQIVEYRKKSNKKKFKNLIESTLDEQDEPEEPVADTYVGYWCPELSLRLLVDFTSFPLNGIPAPVNEHYNISEGELYPDYYPIGYVDSFWVLKDQYIELNDTVSELDLKVSYSPISLWKYQFQIQMASSWEQQEQYGMNEEGDSEEVRRMIIETNPYYLGLTMVITILHMVFDFLAFKNDISFWKNADDMRGLSVKTIFLNCGCQIVIFLYLLDNDTSWMILLSCGVGVIIEFWKIRRAAIVTYGTSGGWFGVLPWVKIEDKQSYIDSGTSKYDTEAMRYLSYALYPIIVCYAFYSLFYEEHKGWYAFILSSLVGTVYTFGFIMQCPQLYLNYKLKSVAHLPWRMLTYKFLNTIVDDLFAFIIKMPTMHRISCFRDDIVFLIFLYQKWIYPVDYTRVNEFGYKSKQEGDDEISNEARWWIQNTAAQHKLPCTDLAKALKDGRLLAAMVNSIKPRDGFTASAAKDAEKLLDESLKSLAKESSIDVPFPSTEVSRGSAPILGYIQAVYDGIHKKNPDWRKDDNIRLQAQAAKTAAAKTAAADTSTDTSTPASTASTDTKPQKVPVQLPVAGVPSNATALSQKWVFDMASAEEIDIPGKPRYDDGKLLCALANSLKAGSFDVYDLGPDKNVVIDKALGMLQRSSKVQPQFTSLEVSQNVAAVDDYLVEAYVGIKSRRANWRPSDVLERAQKDNGSSPEKPKPKKSNSRKRSRRH